MVPELETNRLLLRPLALADAGQIQDLFPHWEIVKYLNASIPWPYPADGALVYCRDFALPAMERGDEWYWTLRLKAAPKQLVGAIGLNKGKNTNRGFWLAPAWQGRGLITEAVLVTNDYWFDVLGFPLLRAPKAVANIASRRVSEKTGMRVVATEEHLYVSGQLRTEMWEIGAKNGGRKGLS